ncbi:MAG: response regulator [Burkholderiaceae bacterium]|nr:response regulator [Burkholderiaceae bacterium]
MTLALDSLSSLPSDCSTRDVAQVLGLAVRSVQLMVDRGELDAWKTPGGHRRIARASVERWLAQREGRTGGALGAAPAAVPSPSPPASGLPSSRRRVLLIEDSAHFQRLVRLLVAQNFPEIDLHVVDNGIAGLAMAGQLQPDVLIVDILLPGIDGVTLIASLRSHPQFSASRLIVATALDEAQRRPYDLALAGVPVVHKPRLVQDLPVLLAQALAAQGG